MRAVGRAVGAPVVRLSGSHYRLIKQIVTEMVSPPDGMLQHTGLVRAIGSRDRHVEWVLEEDVNRFEREGWACLHPKYTESIGSSRSVGTATP